MREKIFEPIKVGNVDIKNRIMYLAMAKRLSDPGGFVTDRQIAYYRALGQGGAGLIIPGLMLIDPDWPSFLPLQPGIYDDKFLAGLAKLADEIHSAGAKTFFQLWHPGEVNYIPGKKAKTINELTISEIKGIQRKYAQAAKRAKAAGADGIEYQICHNYLGSQFLSPLFNKRTDRYGLSTFDDQIRFSLEVIENIMEAAGRDFAISVKLNASDMVPGGIEPELAKNVAQVLEKVGVSMISVSAGGVLLALTGMSAGGEKPEGWKSPFAQIIKAAVKSIPVAATDSIRHPGFAEQLLTEGKCDIIGMGRGLLAEHEWANKVKSGREEELRYCVSCNACFNNYPAGHAGCTVNPFALREYKKPALVRDGDKRLVAIVGAGPAGLEAAVTLAERNFNVVLFEKTDSIGGMVNLGKIPPDKQKLEWITGYYQKQIDRLGIELNLMTTASESALLQLNPYAIIIATGSLPYIPRINGIYKDHVLTVRHALTEMSGISDKNIVVAGAGMAGIEIGEMYLEKDNKVIVLDILPEPDMAEIPKEQQILLKKVRDKGLIISMNRKLVEIKDNDIIIEETTTGAVKAMPADYVILSLGFKPDRGLYEEIKSKFDRVYNIGDSSEVGSILNAIQSGADLAYALN